MPTENIDFLSVEYQAITFIPGQSVNSMPLQSVEIVIVNDTILEITETFFVQLTSDRDYVMITTGRETAAIWIIEDDSDCKTSTNVIHKI